MSLQKLLWDCTQKIIDEISLKNIIDEIALSSKASMTSFIARHLACDDCGFSYGWNKRLRNIEVQALWIISGDRHNERFRFEKNGSGMNAPDDVHTEKNVSSRQHQGSESLCRYILKNCAVGKQSFTIWRLGQAIMGLYFYLQCWERYF